MAIVEQRDEDVLFTEDEPFEEIEPEPPPKRRRQSNGNGQHRLDQIDEPLPPAFSESALASRFIERHADQLRYTAAWGKWFELLPSGKWQIDEKLHIFDLAHAVCREASAEPESEKVASAIASAKTVAAVLTLSRANTSIAASVDQWDADPFLLNTPDGALDLRDQEGGKPRPRPGAYCTKSTAVSPAGACPLWRAFLERVTDGNVELELFLQRMAGYCLTGSTQEHALFFLCGTGANGKSVFLTTLSGVLGNYATTAPIETFTASNQERHPTDLAMLRGARLVTATETEEGRRWAEAKIKQLTGGDRIAARFMRQDFFQFTPAFKLLIAGNHKPGLRSVDEAIRRRLYLVPFTVTIPEEERDPELAEKLKAEWPGILLWAIDGCHLWAEQGLDPPDSVRAATDAYLEAEDAVTTWIEDCCERDLTAWEPASALYTSFKAWAEKAGEYVLSQKRFGQSLEARGVMPERTMSARGYRGLRTVQATEKPYWQRD